MKMLEMILSAIMIKNIMFYSPKVHWSKFAELLFIIYFPEDLCTILSSKLTLFSSTPSDMLGSAILQRFLSTNWFLIWMSLDMR